MDGLGSFVKNLASKHNGVGDYLFMSINGKAPNEFVISGENAKSFYFEPLTTFKYCEVRRNYEQL